MPPKHNRVMTLNITPGKQGTNIDRDMYEVMRRAILKVVPRNNTGVPFKDLPKLVKPHFSQELFKNASVGWYTTTVKLDLEARDEIVRIAGVSPQRLRRQ